MKSPVPDYLEHVLKRYAPDHSGEVKDAYRNVPECDPDQLAIAITTVEGATYCAGDADNHFPIESMSKPFIYGLALEDSGEDAVHRKIGVEPSGDAFNEISLESSTGRPFNAMINAGAIAAHALVSGADCDERTARIRRHFSQLAGRELSFDESEHNVPHRNLAIGHMLRTVDVLEEEPAEVVRGYTRQCAFSVTTRDLSLMAATFANGGLQPISGDKLLSRATVRQVLSVMLTCGMYDAAGDWMSAVGIPAKSGIAGGIIGVLPGQLGIAVYSPRVDSRGNSVRGVELFEHLSRDMELHLMETPPIGRSVFRASEVRGTALCYQLQGAVRFAGIEAVVREVEQREQKDLAIIFDFVRVTGFSDVARRLTFELVRRLVTEDHASIVLVDPDGVLGTPEDDAERWPTVVDSLESADALIGQ
ncbi:glutaminase A [Hoyosella altamirensis]|uniref:Glutaminase n=1 Tax=Hoyosella altamirensis TaxID=616997 RepID=A0A839RN66_9ACTN|nr:glutaminase A [Hoyosella altamirensis]MBB3038195.1 glutaminase [Hoyosella altamirensis]